MKIIFELDESKEDFDRSDLECMAQLPKIRSALYEFGDLLSIIVNRKFYEDTDYLSKDGKEYVNIEYVERKMYNIWDEIKHLVD